MLPPLLLPNIAAPLGTVSALGPLALNAPIITTGDSWASGSVTYISAVDNRGERWSVPDALWEYLGNKWRYTVQGNKAVSGTTSAQIAAQLAGALSTVPASTPFVWFCPERFLNSLLAGTPATSGLADWATDIAAVRAAGGRCIIGTCPPAQPGNPFTGAQETQRGLFNVGTRALAAKDVKVIDYDTLNLVAGDYVNQIHLKTNGWDKAAAAIQSSGLLTAWLPSASVISNLSTEYTDNPGMTGGNSSGPSGWTVDTSHGGGATFAWDASTQTMTIGGAVVGTGNYIDIFRNSSNTPKPAVGDKIEVLIDYNIVSETCLLAIYANGTIWDSGFVTMASAGSSLYAPGVAETAADMARAAGNYVNRSPQVPVANVGTGVPNYRFTDLKIYLNPGAANIVIKVNRLTMQKCV